MKRIGLTGALALALIGTAPCRAQADGAPSAASRAALDEANRIEQLGVTAYRAGDFRTAAPLFRQVWELRRKVMGEQAEGTLNSFNNYVTILYRSGAAAEALPLAQECLRLRRAAFGNRHPDVLESMNTLGGILLALGRLKEAEPLFAEALRLQTEIQGERNPDRIEALGNYAYLIMQSGRESEAEPLLAQVLQLRREVLGEQAPETVLSLNNYAAVLLKLGRPVEAKPLFAEAIRRGTALQGPRHPETIQAKNNYAYTVLETEGAKAAEPLFAEVVQLEREVLGPDNPGTLQGLANYGGTLMSLGRLTDAEPILRESMEMRRKALGNRHPDTMQGINNYAALLVEMGKPELAEPFSAEALRLRREVLGPKHPDTLESLSNYALVLRGLGRNKEVEPLLAETLRLTREVQPGQPAAIKAEASYAAFLVELGRLAEAGPMLHEVVDLWKAKVGPDHFVTLEALSNYAGYLAYSRRLEDAAKTYGELVTASRSKLGDRHPDTLRRMQNYATTLALIHRNDEAEKLYAEVLAGRRALFGDSDWDTIQSAMGQAYERMLSADRKSIALEPARLAVAGLRARLAAGLEDNAGQDLLASRDSDRADAYALFADAAWMRGPGLDEAGRRAGVKPLSPAEETALDQEVLLALQDTLTNVTSRAVARNASLHAADRAGLGKEAAEREALLDQRRSLDAQVAASYADSGAEADARRAGLEAGRARIDARLGEIDALLRSRAPDYYSLTRPAALDLVAAKALLGPDEAWLILAPTLIGTQVMLVSDEGIRWTVSPMKPGEVKEAVRRLQWDVGGEVTVSAEEAARWGEEGEGETPYDFRTAYNLYHALIEPIAPALDGKKQLFVSATGPLSSLPLGILVSEVPQGADGDPQTLRSARWFADRIAISVVPSLQSLQFIRQYRAGAAGAGPEKPFIGFGDPLLEGQAQQRGGGRGSGAKGGGDFRRVFAAGASRSAGGDLLANVAELRKLARLPQTRVEIENQWQAFGKPAQSTFLEAAATETQVKQTRLSAGVLSFATHGLLAGEIRGAAEPGLVLTPPANPTATDDGFLTSSEIAALQIDAGWVILSACNTAAGDGSEGAPGLSGLSRAFFFAGATNLLVSHWPVRDDVAAKLTVRAIEIARDNPGLSRSQALQQAMKEIRDNAAHDGPGDSWAHPSAWAPFSLVGDGAK